MYTYAAGAKVGRYLGCYVLERRGAQTATVVYFLLSGSGEKGFVFFRPSFVQCAAFRGTG